ncbi:MAG: hypothetical protein ACRDVE_09605 [Actinocrinis sp.]
MSEADAHQGTSPEPDEQAQRELEAEIRSSAPDEYPTLTGPGDLSDAIPGYSPAPTPRQPPPAARRGILANADPLSIGAGLVFFLIGGAYLLASGGHLTVNAGWTLSMLALGLGLSGVISALVRFGRGGDRARR